jgi:prepilin-type processing-associated H-X9-DG protein
MDRAVDSQAEKNAADRNGIQILWFDGHGPHLNNATERC